MLMAKTEQEGGGASGAHLPHDTQAVDRCRIHHLVTQLPPYTCKINSTVVRTSAEDLHLITSPLLQGVKNQSERWPL